MDEERFSRQELLFGAEGQRRIANASVAIVGLGGLGSHVGQQLAYLGTRRFALIDRDTVSTSNLNRLVGATPEDATASRRKVDVGERLIRAVTPEADVRPVADSLISHDGFDAIRGADFVFGCVDRDGVRLILNELCQAYERPYFDLATDTGTVGGLWFGGRVLFSTAGELCLVCKELLDDGAVRTDLSTEGQRAEEERIYGVRRQAAVGGPSVVSLNGIIASVAVNEFMLELTGVRSAQRSLQYRGMPGVLTNDRTPPGPDCYYCKGVRGQGDGADVERYIREGWGRLI